MPRKPKRPCSYPGCPELTEGRYCAEHEELAARNYERYDREVMSRIFRKFILTTWYG